MLIEVGVWNDPRVQALADRNDATLEQTLGELLRVWACCYTAGAAVLATADVNIAAQRPGFAMSLVEVGLADPCSGGVRIHGAHRALAASEPTENDDSSYARVRTRAHARVRTGVRTGAHVPAHSSSGESSVVHGGPESPDSADTPERDARDLDPDRAIESILVPSSKGEISEKPRVTRAEIRPVTDAFMTRYADKHGKKPSWTARDVKHIKTLIQREGVDEVVRRVHVMFDDPPRWMLPPFTLNTLVAHWNALVDGQAKIAREHNASRGPAAYGRYEPPKVYDPRAPWEIPDDE